MALPCFCTIKGPSIPYNSNNFSTVIMIVSYALYTNSVTFAVRPDTVSLQKGSNYISLVHNDKFCWAVQYGSSCFIKVYCLKALSLLIFVHHAVTYVSSGVSALGYFTYLNNKDVW